MTLREVAALVGGELRGDGDVSIVGVAPVDEAEPDEAAFLASKRYARFVSECRAGSYLVIPALVQYVPPGLPCVVVERPHPALRQILSHFFPVTSVPAEIHPTAIIGRGVRLGSDIGIGPYAVLEEDVTIGSGTRIGAHCVIGRGTSIGDDCFLHPQVVVYHRTVIGSRCMLHAGVRIGCDGFGFTFVDGAHLKMPQVGRAIIGDDVEIQANSAVDRGSLGDTVVGDGVKIDNLVQVAHNVRVGAFSLLAALVGIAGSTRLGKGVWMGGQVGASNHLTIGDGARMAIATKIMRDVPAGETVSGHPGRPHREELKKQAHLSRLPKLVERVRALEAEVERLTGAGGGRSAD